MKTIPQRLQEVPKNTFGYFSHVYVFGSSLSTDFPKDIDILLVYDNLNLDHVCLEKARLAEILAGQFPEYSFDYTTLSRKELEETQFLAMVTLLELTA